jgi:spermidine synthase
MEQQALSEMITHVPLCTHKEPKKVLVIGENKFANELDRYELEKIDIVNSIEEINDKYDVIISTLDVSDSTNELYISLNDDGVMATLSTNYDDNSDRLKADLNSFGEKFWITMPYSFEDTTLILSSKKYHPTADIVLQRSDLLDNLSYYNSELQLASFIYPTYITTDLTGVAKR